jgi:hypothetical protein
MSNREKIIIGLMIAAVLYGGFELIFAKRGADRTPAALEDLSGFVAEMGALAAASEGAGSESYVIEKAAADWKRDPFVPAPMVAEYEAKTSDTGVVGEALKVIQGGELGLTYTGYLLSGENSLAIVNGLEYEVGETLEMPGGYIIMDIKPGQVEIAQEGTANKIVIPLDEPEL